MNFSVQSVFDVFVTLLPVLPKTLLFAGLILLASLLSGSLVAFVRIQKWPLLSRLARLYTSYMRGIPIIVHLLFIDALLPKFLTSSLQLLGLIEGKVRPASAVIILLTFILFETAMEAETIRGLYQAFDKGQVEAGLAIGLTPFQVIRRIVGPQILKTGLPIFLNAFVKLIKNLSIAFAVGFVEIFASARYAAALNAAYIESYVAAGLLYWMVCGFLQTICNRLEKKQYIG